MATPVLDSSLPADSSALSSGQMRGQFQASQSHFDAYAFVTQLALTVSNPPTQAEVQAIAVKLDKIITVLQTT
jgi:hypothetical protein